MQHAHLVAPASSSSSSSSPPALRILAAPPSAAPRCAWSSPTSSGARLMGPRENDPSCARGGPCQCHQHSCRERSAQAHLSSRRRTSNHTSPGSSGPMSSSCRLPSLRPITLATPSSSASRSRDRSGAVTSTTLRSPAGVGLTTWLRAATAERRRIPLRRQAPTVPGSAPWPPSAAAAGPWKWFPATRRSASPGPAPCDACLHPPRRPARRVRDCCHRCDVTYQPMRRPAIRSHQWLRIRLHGVEGRVPPIPHAGRSATERPPERRRQAF